MVAGLENTFFQQEIFYKNIFGVGGFSANNIIARFEKYVNPRMISYDKVIHYKNEK